MHWDGTNILKNNPEGAVHQLHPQQTNRDPTGPREEYLLWMVLLLFLCSAPERGSSCEPSIGFRVAGPADGARGRWGQSGGFQAPVLSARMNNEAQ